MIEEDLNPDGQNKRKVLGDVTNRLPKRNHPLLPGKFLIGHETIRKNDTSTSAKESEDPGARKKRVIGELVNINKGKQQLYWRSENLNHPSLSRNKLPDSDSEVSGREGNFSSATVDFMNLQEKSAPEEEHRLNLAKPSSDVPGKNCSCSICLKARFIWADILCEDRKVRLAEVNKSRRMAKSFAGSTFCRDNNGVVGRDEKYEKLEQELRKQWKALFVHTESLIRCESAQLQSSLVKFEELRESCKRDVEKIDEHKN